jgi:hypothetical protein
MIERRFRGPPDSGNGGYTCGLLAAAIDPAPAVEVTLRVPPPLDRPLSRESEDGAALLRDGDTPVAEARAADEPELSIPDPVSLEDAEAARRDSPLHQHHPFPSCFVCGPEREPGDGMCVTCGPVPGREQELVAAPWQTDRWMAAENGAIREELVWSALDCPSGLAAMLVPGLGVTVLGRLTAMLPRPVDPGPPYVAIGWPIEREGRKLRTGSAILDRSGKPLAWARATWVELRDQPAGRGGYGKPRG